MRMVIINARWMDWPDVLRSLRLDATHTCR